MTINIHGLNAPVDSAKAAHDAAMLEDECLFIAHGEWTRARLALLDALASGRRGYEGGPSDIYRAGTEKLARHAPESLEGMRLMLTAASQILAAREIDGDSVEGDVPVMPIVITALRALNYGTGEFAPYWRA